jgi:hypothetical protein
MAEGDVRRFACGGCSCGLAVELVAGVVTTADGGRGSLTYLDRALAVWDCPECGYTDAAELHGG